MHDKSLCDDVAKAFAEMGDKRVHDLTNRIQAFCGKYTNGYYGDNPGRYAQKNPDLIDHLLCCFASEKTPELEFEWKDDEERRFVAFLEERYDCKRTH